ncbi:hypothetical protein [Paenibacillus sp. YPG26]|uniref:hypothetical protein n=1 Tax=Paenibacillus sp. YPG26 TaxID=2878915 RepID=UPI00203F2B23|nr:hypothetical protein [Paenibacillus sp. YPG26]USB34742.1 hypothetical protein LDO05_08315 [Paenibacillus sp. YPG26]
MNERLSRVERYSRKQHEIRAVRDRAAQVTEGAIGDQVRLSRSKIHGNRTDRQVSAPVVDNIELDEPSSAIIAEDEMSAAEMPPRREVYPSQRIKWTKWFYNSLVIIFIALLILLFFWGMQQSTWGKQH